VSAGYEIVPTSVRHLKPMALGMRAASWLAMERYGQNPRAAVHRAFMVSHYRRTALIDGKPVAMWGVAGSLLNECADVWLFLSRDVEKMPLAIVREARAELSQAADLYSHLEATLLPEDEPSVRFARFLGFGGDSERIPIGDSYVLRMTYQPEGMH